MPLIAATVGLVLAIGATASVLMMPEAPEPVIVSGVQPVELVGDAQPAWPVLASAQGVVETSATSDVRMVELVAARELAERRLRLMPAALFGYQDVNGDIHDINVMSTERLGMRIKAVGLAAEAAAMNVAAFRAEFDAHGGDAALRQGLPFHYQQHVMHDPEDVARIRQSLRDRSEYLRAKSSLMRAEIALRQI